LLSEILLHGHPEDRRDERVLMLEVSAEATRNPAVAAIVQDAHRRVAEQAVALFKKRHPHLSDQQANACVYFVGALVDGTALRRVNGLTADDETLSKLYRDVITLALEKR